MRYIYQNAIIVNIYIRKFNEVREKLKKSWNTLNYLQETDEDIKTLTNVITPMKVSVKYVRVCSCARVNCVRVCARIISVRVHAAVTVCA